jgi:regulator of sigma E protease
MEVSVLAESIGFLDGDRILEVDGVILDDVTDVNRNLFLRSVETILVHHPDGLKETLSVPEDFGSKMFQSGDLRPITLLRTSNY